MARRPVTRPPLPGAVKAPLPLSVAPQLVLLANRPPAAEGWEYEVKFDGYRMLARIDEADVRLLTRNGHNWTARLPRLAREVRQLGLRQAWLDGELVAHDEAGFPSFSLLQQAFDRGTVDDLVLYAFDLLFLDGWDLRGAALEDRRRLLSEMMGDGTALVRRSATLVGSAEDIFASACEMNLEGVVAKRRGSTYEGERNGSWVKLKCTRTDRFVVGGYTLAANAGTRAGVSAILVGQSEPDGTLRYAGRVGTGFSQAQARHMREILRAIEVPDMPFDIYRPERRFGRRSGGGTHWVRPFYGVAVAFVEMTDAGHLRHASLRGEDLSLLQ